MSVGPSVRPSLFPCMYLYEQNVILNVLVFICSFERFGQIGSFLVANFAKIAKISGFSKHELIPLKGLGLWLLKIIFVKLTIRQTNLLDF